jgi:hypothetical protein
VELGDALHNVLTTAVLVGYARPFSKNRPYGPLPTRWGEFSNPRATDFHRQVLTVRNTVLAHSDGSVRAVHVIPPGVKFGALPTVEEIVITVHNRLVPPEWFPHIVDLCRDLLPRMTAEINRLSDDLYGRPGIQFPTSRFVLDDSSELFPSQESNAPSDA